MAEFSNTSEEALIEKTQGRTIYVKDEAQTEPKVNILLVDDRPENLLALSAVLESLEQNLVKANSGSEALRCLLNQDFAVILTDVQMPGMDGFETATLIRERKRSQHTPIIFITGLNQNDTHVFRGYSLGAVDYLLKPFDPEILKSKVAVFISLFKKTEEVKRQAARLEAANKELEREINSRKLAEEALRRVHDELEIKVQFRTAELALANESLQAEITSRKRAEHQIKVSLQEKEVLLKEIHHRVKNNLQIISSLLNIQSEYIQEKEVLEMFKVSQNRIASMALIHEKLYQSKDLARIEFGEYIRDLVANLFVSYETKSYTVAIKINIDDIFLSIDAAIPCGLIINELVLNSLKHAFPVGSSGDILINFYSENEKFFTLIVSDNGIGLPQNFDFKNTGSLGLQLVDDLINQLSGTIEINRSSGVEFKIKFQYENK